MCGKSCICDKIKVKQSHFMRGMIRLLAGKVQQADSLGGSLAEHGPIVIIEMAGK